MLFGTADLWFRCESPFFGPIHLALVGLMAGRQAGWLAGWLEDEMQVEVEIFKIPYRLTYSDFYHV